MDNILLNMHGQFVIKSMLDLDLQQNQAFYMYDKYTQANYTVAAGE